ncbi:hypothetical protein OAT16_00060 [Prolixibacteraceae bacterium]|nr:hypothetical protein [Prolixibacteraceae bacterium]
MNPKRRDRIQLILFIFLIFSIIFFLVNSICNNDSTQTMASIALLISVVSLFVTLLSYNNILDSKLPQVLVDLDASSRNELVMLVVKNVGEKPAFNISVEFNKEIPTGENGKYFCEKIGGGSKKTFGIKSINTTQEYKYIIGLGTKFFKWAQRESDPISANIVYYLCDSKRKRYRMETKVIIDAKIYGRTASYESEKEMYYFKMQSLPEQLKDDRAALLRILHKLEKKD